MAMLSFNAPGERDTTDDPVALRDLRQFVLDVVGFLQSASGQADDAVDAGEYGFAD